MWDYQIGLVRITPFFKACKLSKVCPTTCRTVISAPLLTSHH
jgi:hypothetical protein